MNHPNRSWEDNNGESNMDYGGPDGEVSEGNNINNWAKDYCFNILVNNVAVILLLWLQSAWGLIEDFWIIFSLAEEISRDPNIDSDK